MYTDELIESLNKDIEHFPQVYPITPDMKHHFVGISRLVMLDRYSFKDTKLKTLKEKDLVVLTVKEDPKWPTRGVGYIQEIDWDQRIAKIQVEEEFVFALEGEEAETGIVTRHLDSIEKPLELYYEQIAKRNATGLSAVEKTKEKQKEWFEKFYKVLNRLDFVPAGRVLYGAGSGANVTYFNCYVMPYPQDSREGIAEHRKKVMEIMSRGGGVGTNGSTLRPRNALARGVNGKSSGAVSWLDDIAKLTHLVEQGGSRRGAQMIMLADWHPDIIEFIISKMQNPNVLRYIIETTNDEQIKQAAQEKLKFTPLTNEERAFLEAVVENMGTVTEAGELAQKKLKEGGTWSVHNPDFLTGANISVCITKEFMRAVEFDLDYPLRFPAIEEYTPEEMEYYNKHWHEVGDVREWEKTGLKIRTYRYIKARELWKLINICATYSAEPGIFFIDTANEMTNAQAYGQKVVATNPCFTGDMRILTDEGYKTFKELDGKEVNIININGKSTKGRVWKTGEKPTVIIKLSDKREIRCTKDHRFMLINGEECEAKDLAGKQIMPYIFHNEETEKEFVKYGYIQGDGNTGRLASKRHKGLEINFGKKDNEVRAYFNLNGTKRKEYVTEYNKILKELGFSSKPLPYRTLPSTFEKWTYEQKRAFLKGMYSANGSVLSVGRIAYKTTCYELAHQLKQILNELFDIEAYITTNCEHDVSFENGTYTCKQSYDVNIGKYKDMVTFFNYIGFIQSYKMKKLKDILMKKAPKVISVKETGQIEEVYDFHEPETHWGIVEGVIAHNCGEQPLAPYSVCNLAAINLSNMASFETKQVDWERLKEAVKIGVRLQDNVIDATPYFLEENRKQALGERRIGMGVMGLHDLLIKCGIRYGSKEGNELTDKIFETIATTAYRTSIELAKEKGSFPFLTHEDKEKELELRMRFINSGYMKRMPEDIRQDILKYGIRNSHLLTVAPTGSTGTMIGCSTGLEPYYAFTYYRSGRLGKFIEVKAKIVEEYLKHHPEADPDQLPDYFVSAMDLTPEEHADVQCVIQRWVDSSISKTVNAPKGYTVEQVQTIYERLYQGGAKGGTVYVDGSRDAQVLSLTAEENKVEEVDVQEEINKPQEERKVGTDIGDICPICQIGTVIDSGGCHTCNNCKAQLKCDL
ncbi:LAGLIDADG family homing endonuclease [Parageobacillus galactosidasius]|uniref:Ribonucleoside-diphosphate reductase n=1 Tax=Parageobacillus galactosidasius TaxID=883812 RepID=A0A226QQT9_9BACL|nr:ribonucleotide reductase N-terminal alpha domain-containing protein [Parageobacillus galactosidasius]OXB94705.1 hypothetical protein B9L23_07515 [Parageobacillus galactosidasius]